MSDIKHRGEKPEGFVFWTNQLFGLEINGVEGTSLTVSANSSALDAKLTFTPIHAPNDANPFGLALKDLFFNFITDPKVYDTAMEIVRNKLGAIAAIQISNFIDREIKMPRNERPAPRQDPIKLLRLISQNDAPKN